MENNPEEELSEVSEVSGKSEVSEAPELTALQEHAPPEQASKEQTAQEQVLKESPPKDPPSGLLIIIKDKLVERSPKIEIVSRQKLKTSSRRSFLTYGAGMAAAASGLWWLLPDEAKEQLGFPTKTGQLKKDFLESALKFDDDVATALFSKDRLVPTFQKSDMTEVPNNFAGQTPDPGFIDKWKLKLTGLAGKETLYLSASDLRNQFQIHEQITRLVCVEGWSAISWWGGLRFADLIKKYPPRAGTKWCQIRSEVNLDGDGNSDPYFVSFDILSAMHPQTLLATQHNGKSLELEHGAPLRLLAPMKLGLKNIKAITSIAYHLDEPDDYWNKDGYSYYDGI